MAIIRRWFVHQLPRTELPVRSSYLAQPLTCVLLGFTMKPVTVYLQHHYSLPRYLDLRTGRHSAAIVRSHGHPIRTVAAAKALHGIGHTGGTLVRLPPILFSLSCSSLSVSLLTASTSSAASLPMR